MENSSAPTQTSGIVDIIIGAELIQDYSDNKLSFDPTAEHDIYNHSRYCDVLTAAQLLGKSPRQVQRLLKQGKLVGHKIAGRNGLEWKIDREVLSFNPANLSINDAMAEQIAAMEIKIEGLADAVVALKSRIDSFDSQFDRIRNSESISESTATELGLLKEQLDQTKKIIQEVAALERQEERLSPEREITEPNKFDKGGQDKGAQDKGRQDKGPKLSWWQRVLAEKQFV